MGGIILDKGVQTIDRSLDIIELLAIQREGMGVTDIGQYLSLHKSTVHRLVNALCERGYVEKDSRYSTYKLGLKFLELSSIYLNKLELKTEALPYMRKLAEIVGQPVHLAILDGHEAVYIEKIEANTSIRMYSQIGRRVPVYCSAIGKVLLAGIDELRTEKLVEKIDFKKHTNTTIMSKEDLLNEISVVRSHGWSLDNEEHEMGVRCIAAPVYDYTGKVIAAVSVSGDLRVISKDKDDETSKLVVEVADAISRHMGHIKKS